MYCGAPHYKRDYGDSFYPDKTKPYACNQLGAINKKARLFSLVASFLTSFSLTGCRGRCAYHMAAVTPHWSASTQFHARFPALNHIVSSGNVFGAAGNVGVKRRLAPRGASLAAIWLWSFGARADSALGVSCA